MSSVPRPIDFYVDFSSPYSYIASEWIEGLAAQHGRTVAWQAILLGATFQAAELKSPVSHPLKREYSLLDFERSARFAGVPLHMPAKFPIPTQNAARVFWWLHEGADAAGAPLGPAGDRAGTGRAEDGAGADLAGTRGSTAADVAGMAVGADAAKAERKQTTAAARSAPAWARHCLRAYFVHGIDLSDAAALGALAVEFGLAPGQAEAVWNDAQWKARLKSANDAAIAQGVFGAPFFRIDGEPFWGHDRRAQMERWLARGPF